jgi:hypothetical protein
MVCRQTTLRLALYETFTFHDITANQKGSRLLSVVSKLHAVRMKHRINGLLFMVVSSAAVGISTVYCSFSCDAETLHTEVHSVT